MAAPWWPLLLLSLLAAASAGESNQISPGPPRAATEKEKNIRVARPQIVDQLLCAENLNSFLAIDLYEFRSITMNMFSST
jgi:hypothetical protein